MEDQLELSCLATSSEGSDVDVFANAARAMLAAAALTCIGTPPKPGVEMIVADLTNGAYIAPMDGQFWRIPPGVDRINYSEVGSSDVSLVSNHLEGLVTNLSMPKAWQEEGVEAPSPACHQYSLQVLRRLFDSYGIIPYKITVSKDGGVFAAYKTPQSKNILRIEVDNELDVVAVVSDGDSILDSGLLEADDLEQSLINRFNRSMA